MDWKGQWRRMAWIAGGLAACVLMPVGEARFDRAVGEALAQVRGYARDHVLLGMIPAFFIAGAIRAFVRRDTLLRYLGPRANRAWALAVAAVSGAVLTVCSCTVLPLFASIYKAGAGLGPACAFLYSGPAINVTATLITARVLGFELAAVRAVGAVLFSGVIGLAMWGLFGRGPAGAAPQEEAGLAERAAESGGGVPGRRAALLLALLLALLVAANWGAEGGCAAEHADGAACVKGIVHGRVVALLAAAAGVLLVRGFGLATVKALAAALGVAAVAALTRDATAAFAAGALGLWWACATARGPLGVWASETWASASGTLPLLLVGIGVSGFLLGGPGGEGLVPSEWVIRAVGGNSLRATFLSALCSALMYFSTCTEVPLLQGLMAAGMGRGPVLALMLAGPALSLPGLLLVSRVLGVRRAAVFALLVVAMATLTGWAYGLLA